MSFKAPHVGIRVPPMSGEQITRVANQIRQLIRLGSLDPFPVMHMLEFVMPETIDGFDVEIVDSLPEERLGCCFPDGCTDHPQGPKIYLLEQVYKGACRNNAFDRMTVTHEISHVFLHSGISPTYSRDRNPRPIKAFEDAEWQANSLAGDLLMPAKSFLSARNIYSFRQSMGVTRTAVRSQAKKLIRRGALENGTMGITVEC